VLATSFAGDLKLGAEELARERGAGPAGRALRPARRAALASGRARGQRRRHQLRAIGGDTLGHTLVAGYTYNSEIDFGMGPLPSGPSGALVFKLDPAGALVWEHRYSDNTSDAAATRLAVGPGGEVALAGTYKGGWSSAWARCQGPARATDSSRSCARSSPPLQSASHSRHQ
jgi:hypothetical protein